jgi:endonuclease-3 related protein
MLASHRPRGLIAALRTAYGPQRGWWPQVGGAIEVCAGAILVQHTTWASAARAIEALRAAGVLDARGLFDLPEGRLEELVRPAGTYRAKARTLRELARVVVEEYRGDLEVLFRGSVEDVRARLLAIRGIGPETADAITLYGAGLPTFVVDAYALRVLRRTGVLGESESRASSPASRHAGIRRLLVDIVGPDIDALQEAHALFVEHGRAVCVARRPRCNECVLQLRCATAREARDRV